ncbi:lipopolysaccharide biosynthesis protein [Streptomyces sp. MI02-2A]|uniref:lipopolysaccharide biosynthesis protein n=1 Tax=unclassified Streptomyces TaxID=2593676 RepID=UPI000E25A29F|nr:MULTISPECIES: lipopolysaccharide biosynthesis protein [unclassified Streptomyces]MDX3260644.1 lipopolysaccharide biosynthesis protein [Streptomyces sp. MI02-2A]REE63925.1 Mrp family chromosome partitioning ATPase [Streptomyces sp. 3212.3]
MSDTHVPLRGEDEPEQLREQFRQLLRYRWLIGGGVGVGLLAGAWLGITGADSYAATTDIVLRAPTSDPFAPTLSSDKALNMGSERQTALSRKVAEEAAKRLGLAADEVDRLQHGLQVTNPPQTLVLHFSYTGSDPKEAARRANALTQSYIDLRKEQWESVQGSMLKSLQNQLNPVAKQNDELSKRLKQLPDGSAADSAYAVQANLLSRITELSSKITSLKMLDMTPGSVIRNATAPTSPDGPGLPLSLGLGGLVGVGLGLLGAWMRLVFDPAPRSAGDVARAVHGPVLGALPRGSAGALVVGRTDSRAAEEYRSIAFRLAYDERFADRRRLLVVAPRGSMESSVGVAANLAASFAETGKNVLLVEADLRTPSLSERLDVSAASRPRWSSTVEPAEGEWPGPGKLLVDAGESGAFGLVPGERVRNVPRALTSARTTRLIAEADDPDATVVVVAPPVLAYADALALVDRVDGVLIVCDPRTVHRADLVRIRELIVGAGGTVLGAVTHTDSHRREAAARRNSRRRAAKSAAVRPAARPGTRLETERHIDGDGSDTIALRTVRSGDR